MWNRNISNFAWFFEKQDTLHHKYGTFCTFNLKLHIINENC